MEILFDANGGSGGVSGGNDFYFFVCVFNSFYLVYFGFLAGDSGITLAAPEGNSVLVSYLARITSHGTASLRLEWQHYAYLTADGTDDCNGAGIFFCCAMIYNDNILAMPVVTMVELLPRPEPQLGRSYVQGRYQLSVAPPSNPLHAVPNLCSDSDLHNSSTTGNTGQTHAGNATDIDF